MKERHLIDFKLYERFSTMTPMWPNKEVSDPNGFSPYECFIHSDSYGNQEPMPCNDILKLRLLQHGKKMVNLQIEMWVDGTFDFPCTLFPWEVKEHTKDWPKWVYESYVRQLSKRYLDSVGFIPKFVSSPLNIDSDVLAL